LQEFFSPIRISRAIH